jgi:hypothetical protein
MLADAAATPAKPATPAESAMTASQRSKLGAGKRMKGAVML